MEWSSEKISEIYYKVQRMAVTDEEFRAELLTDPDAAIAKAAGERLPEDVKVKVIENDPHYAATFVLPPMAADELNDEDLDRVAGGACLVRGCGADACGADAIMRSK